MRWPATFLVLAFSSLAGCSDSGADRTTASEGSPHNVAYFLAHSEEHEAAKLRCKNDPGALRNTPDCVNADQAQKQIFVWGREDAVRRSKENL